MDYEFSHFYPRHKFSPTDQGGGSGDLQQDLYWREHPLKFIILFYLFVLVFLIFYKFLRATHQVATSSPIWAGVHHHHHTGSFDGPRGSRWSNLRGGCGGRGRLTRSQRRLNHRAIMNQLSLEIVNEIIERNRALNAGHYPAGVAEEDPPPEYIPRDTTIDEILINDNEDVPTMTQQVDNDPCQGQECPLGPPSVDLQSVILELEIPPPSYESIINNLTLPTNTTTTTTSTAVPKDHHK